MSWRSSFVGEFVGTFLLVFFGCGSVAAAVLTGAQVGIFQVAVVWGIGIATAIYVAGSLSGAHLNPAVTLAFATVRDFPWRRVPGYIVAQMLGAFAGAAIVHGLFAGQLLAYEAANQIVRGAAGSEASGMIFGEYFPNPGGRPFTDEIRARVSAVGAFGAEVMGTAVLVLVILAVTDERNRAPPRELGAVTIGLTVTALISLIAPLTQAGFNPARDFGPRVWSALAGWGSVPFAANGSGWFTVYILAPMLGGQLGAVVYRFVLQPAYSEANGDSAGRR